jgi:glucoamylase
MNFLNAHFRRRLLRCWDSEMRLQPSSGAAEKGHRRSALLIIVALAALVTLGGNVAATDAPGAPGGPSWWTTGAKQGLGTSTTVQSTVWYTIAEGVVTEVYYPEVDVPNVRDLQFIVTDGSTFVDLERDATTHQVQLADPQALTYRQVNTDKANTPRYRITRTLVTDPDRPVLLMDTRFEALSGGPYQVYLLYDPSLDNSGLGDTGATSGNALVANDGSVASALVSSIGFTKMSSGYSGTSSDGLVDLRAHKQLSALFDSASTPGNLVQIGQINVGNDTTFTLALGFGATRSDAASNASASLAAGFAAVRNAYENGWHTYLASLKPAPNSITSNTLVTNYNVALMTLKAHEDKTFRGANIASLTIPWGQAVSADRCCTAGYHAVWARDLYEEATAMLAAGDAAAANRSLDYLLTVQQRNDGSMPQNTRLNGTPVYPSLQMDEVAYPIVLAWHLNRTDAATWAKLKKSADFIVNRGAFTPEERWEEAGGFSPSTIAAEIAGLVCAADIAQKNGDGAASTYLATADDWQRNIENWTFTTTGPLGDHQYYIRIGNDQNPNDGSNLGIANCGGNHDEREIVDAGFLELVRLGVKPANDPRVAESLSEIDATIKATPPEGEMFHRYDHDGYGETADGHPYTGCGVGRLWPIFSGERGEYELANGNTAKAVERLKTMAGAANAGFMIPEQVWDGPDMDRPDGRGKFIFGQGTDSATPLAWSMAQFVRLALSIDAGKPVETPKVVADRYAHPPITVRVTFNVTVPSSTDGTGKSVFIVGELDKLDPPLAHWNPASVKMNRLNSMQWNLTLTGQPGTTIQYKYVLGDWAFDEKGGNNCNEISNRSMTISGSGSGTQVVNDTVANWRNVPPCGN